MGKGISRVKYIRDFNLEERVFKYIEKDKKPSPRHPSTVKRFQEEEYIAPKIDEYEANKNVTINAKAINLQPTKLAEIKTKNLPADRNMYEEFQYGMKEPDRIPHGRLTLRMFDDIWSSYKDKKTKENINALSKKFNLESEKLEMLLEYFKPFTTVVQTETKSNQASDELRNIGKTFSNIKLPEK